jgi:hypothetical protein
MEFTRDDPSARIIIPDKPTVRQQLAYFSAARPLADDVDWLKLWQGAIGLSEVWSCELIPNPAELDLDKETDPKITEVIAWAASNVRKYMLKLGEIPKNS